ncbi:MAG: HD domain-containing phosphohydrolase [Rhodospirillales bacterium]
MTNKVLIVEDETEIREEVHECLTDEGYDCVDAVNGEQGLERIRQDPEIAVVLTDLRMPGRSGLEMIGVAKSEIDDDRELEFIIMTGHGGTQQAIDALQLGVMDFLEKPIDVNHVIHVVRRAEELVVLKRAGKHYQKSLKADVEAKTIKIQGLLDNLEIAYSEVVDCLAMAAEFKDPETGNHIRRIGEYAKVVAAELGWSKERQRVIGLAAPLHDVGKIGTPESVLLKKDKLTPDEVVIMNQHVEIGQRILSNSKHPVMVVAANIALGHHERWDGGGYPRGLKGAEVPIEARITMLGDIYDALRSERPYKPAFDHEKVLSIMLEGDNRTDPSHFDPELLTVFKAKSDAFQEIFDTLAD